MSVLQKKWEILNQSNRTAIEKVLSNRQNILDLETVSLHDPFLFEQMDRAVKRITDAIEYQELIVIFGDYDVDGITAAATLIKVLRKLNAKLEYRLPNRMHDGYGLSNKFIDQFIEKEVKLLITVDCGISCAEQIAHAKANGIDTIITDHHNIPAQIPDAYAILHPKHNSSYPCSELTGSGVAFKLAEALIKTHFPAAEQGQQIDALLELACMGTIADMGALHGENRLIVQRGLRGLNQTKSPGLRALKKVSNISEGQPMTASSIGFQLGPRINAAGRIGDPYIALELLIREEQDSQTENLAAELESLNLQRRDLTDLAIASAAQRIDPLAPPALIIEHSSDWHTGILGLIAGKLAEKYARPTIIMQDLGDTLVASARSPEFFNIVEAITACGKYLISFGGHAQAAGLTLKKSQLPDFEKAMTAYTEAALSQLDPKPTLRIDCEIRGDEISAAFLSQLSALEPFGIGNSQPTFVIRDAVVDFPEQIGKDKSHLKFTLNTDSQKIKVIAFRMGEFCPALMSSPKIDLVFTIEKNYWNGREYLGLQALDFQIKG